jgi:hypothetical protein
MDNVQICDSYINISSSQTYRSLLPKSKAIPVTDCGGLQVCEMLRISHCLDNRPTDGGKAVSPTHWPCSTPQKHYFYASGTHFC